MKCYTFFPFFFFFVDREARTSKKLKFSFFDRVEKILKKLFESQKYNKNTTCEKARYEKQKLKQECLARLSRMKNCKKKRKPLFVSFIFNILKI